MKRRDFFKTSALGLAAHKSIIKASQIKPSINNPVILSTWNLV